MNDKKQLDTIHTGSLRELVSQVNSLGIQKDDIAQVISNDDGFFLLYYK